MAFIRYYNSLIDILETSNDFKKTSKGILKQMAWSAGGACAGGVVAGPPGALVGGIAGSLVGYIQSDPYKAMIEVLKDLSDKEKEELVDRVHTLVGDDEVQSLTNYVGMEEYRNKLLAMIQNFLNEKKSDGCKSDPQPCARALYDFIPENDAELAFKEGDIINLIRQIDQNWYEGHLRGQTGLLPTSYVTILVDIPR